MEGGAGLGAGIYPGGLFFLFVFWVFFFFSLLVYFENTALSAGQVDVFPPPVPLFLRKQTLSARAHTHTHTHTHAHS